MQCWLMAISKTLEQDEQTMTIEASVTKADMKDEKKRGLRRHHIERLKKCRQHHWGRNLSGKELGKAVNSPCPCSCFLCGNPRRWGEKAVQEKRGLIAVDGF